MTNEQYINKYTNIIISNTISYHLHTHVYHFQYNLLPFPYKFVSCLIQFRIIYILICIISNTISYHLHTHLFNFQYNLLSFTNLFVSFPIQFLIVYILIRSISNTISYHLHNHSYHFHYKTHRIPSFVAARGALALLDYFILCEYYVKTTLNCSELAVA